MCGICGMMGPGISMKDLDIINDLAYVTALRGKDATGICQGRVDKKIVDYRVAKAAQEMSYFQWWHKWDKKGDSELFNSIHDNFMMIHARYATVGKNTNENAHPFETERFVSMHNGTLRDDKFTKHKTKTDSQMMFEEVDRSSLLTVLRNLDEASAYAIVQLDKGTGEIIFARNNARPLFYTWNTERRVMYWASESLMLAFALQRHGAKIDKISSFKEKTIYSLKPTQLEYAKSPKFKILTIPEKEKPIIKVPARNYGGISDLPWVGAVQSVKVIGNTTPNNVVQLAAHNASADERVNKAKKILVECMYCNEVLDLLDQHIGQYHEEIDRYTCKVCNDLIESLEKDQKKAIH